MPKLEKKRPKTASEKIRLIAKVLVLIAVCFASCVDLLHRAAQGSDTVTLTLAEWEKAVKNKAERIKRNKEQANQIAYLQNLLASRDAACIERVLAERVRCAELQKAAKCHCPSNTGLYVCLATCGVIVAGSALGGVAVGHTIKECTK